MERHWQDEQDVRKKIDEEEVKPHPWIRPYVGIEWLKKFLLWQPPKDMSLGECTRFNGLENIVEHIQLKATTAPSEKKSGVATPVSELEMHILQDLLHEDLAIIESACNKIATEIRPSYQQYLLDFLQTPDNPWRQRVSAGDALGFLGDPRFEGKRPWKDDSHWVDITVGKFYRGSKKGDKNARENEYDGNQYPMKGFQIARYPVTYAEYSQFIEEHKDKAPSAWKAARYPTGEGNHPVTYVSWHHAQAYIDWLNSSSKDGYHYFLPTEAQWERAARGPALWKGRENRRRYPWGDEFDAHKCNVHETGLGRTTAVGCFVDGASPEGVLDMAGNVWEWCAGWYDEKYYQKKTVEENKEESHFKVLRGGSFRYFGDNARCACRNLNHPDVGFSNVGFRVARI
ncbi:MAG: formylglycine-generating enzyme family protein, partial [Gammaproteobacteria bacterium]|nr:formylglycine-generating enzyme family protein [Gammaproteobacteria bacterium]